MIFLLPAGIRKRTLTTPIFAGDVQDVYFTGPGLPEYAL
ncbi:hypothetical protein BN1221_03519c [Brenneria goodwinii]|uniref:Uncharacterized protein n=1 Tax=Brenneria goodwinii TaxID=1109412 RepID=A0A0G4JZD8_9GAMM|nr:hypothetical protein BN1221_03519c [Brenneria goodwinii]